MLNDRLRGKLSAIGFVFFLLLVVYGALTDFYIPESRATDLTIFGVNVPELIPSAFTFTQGESTYLHGVQNGVALTGELVWHNFAHAWTDYKDFPHNMLMKLVWLVFGYPIAFIKWFFILIATYFVMIYKLALVGGLSYIIALIISSIVPPALLYVSLKLDPDNDVN